MDILNGLVDLIDLEMVVNNVVGGLILLFFSAIVGGVSGIFVFYYKWKKAEESKKKEKLEQELIKETERKNEISNIIQSLIPEININQNRLQPLSDCVDKVLDCNNCKYSEKESFPEKLHFGRTVYSSLLDKIGLLNYEIIAKVIQYYSETKDIEEEYKKLDVIHGFSNEELNSFMLIFELDEKLGKISYPRRYEIESFLRHTKKVYDLGADLIISMKDK